MLSNTATPRYYKDYRDRVLSGEIPVCKYVSMEMNRIDNMIKDPRIYYDDKAVEGFIRYCEDELTLTDGSDLKLLDTFKVWAEQLFGWYYFVPRKVYIPFKTVKGGKWITKIVKKRLINKQFLILARGGAKSMYLSFIQNYFLNIDNSTTHQITTAPTMRLAEEVMSPIRTSIIRSRGPFFKFLTAGSIYNTKSKVNRAKLQSTKKGVENFLTGSLLEVRPLSIDKLQGLRCKVATIDEWLSGVLREDPITAIEQGASKIDDYVIVASSSEGTVRNGCGDDIKMELMKILKGEYLNAHVSIWYYRLDDINEINDPSMWIKANPNLGKTVSYETYQLEIEKAEASPASRNEIIAKRFGIPMEGYTYFFTYPETLPTERVLDFRNMTCSLGIDLSKGDDFCAFTFLFPLYDGTFGVESRCYITSIVMNNLSASRRKKYLEFIEEGSLVIMESNILDLDQVYDDLEEYYIFKQYNIATVGYDPYNATSFMHRWELENGPYGIEKVRQGSKTESVPLGELKILASQGMLLHNQKIMKYAMGNSVVIEDTNGNRKLSKERRDQKIDPVSAMMDAFVAFKLNPYLYE